MSFPCIGYQNVEPTKCIHKWSILYQDGNSPENHIAFPCSVDCGRPDIVNAGSG
ncbi:unnamed protein product, partial [Staurois parvus]